jgi:hypothetical protein
MAKKKKGGGKKKAKGGAKDGKKKVKKGKKAKNAKNKKPQTPGTEVPVIMPTPLSIFDGSDFIEEFRGETPQEQLDNTAIFRTYRRKPKSLLVQEALAENIRRINAEENQKRMEAGLQPIDPTQKGPGLEQKVEGSGKSSAASSVVGDGEFKEIDPVQLYRQQALNGYGHVKNMPRSYSQWKGSVKKMHQSRFPNVQLRRSKFDQGAGKWGRGLSTEVVPEVVGDGGDGGDESGSSKK